MLQKDHYKTLEVSHNAEDKDIKKAFRRLALRYHPDKNPQNIQEAGEKFKEINEAYEILGDKRKRQQYDNQTSLINYSYNKVNVKETDENNSVPVSVVMNNFFHRLFSLKQRAAVCNRQNGGRHGCKQGKQCHRHRR